MAVMYHPVLSSSPRARQGDAWDEDDDEGFEQTLGALLSGKVRDALLHMDTEQGQDCPHLREFAVLKYDTIPARFAVEPDS